MYLRHFNKLRNFARIAEAPSLSAAADVLAISKGALSQQLMILEQDLGFEVFNRHTRGLSLTDKGRALALICQDAFSGIERQVVELREDRAETLTVGITTYFAARWLSPRLMTFMQAYPDLKLRIQPMVEFSDAEMQDVDLAIRWGDGIWKGGATTPFMPMAPYPVGNAEVAERVERLGLSEAIKALTLLRDREDSNAWSDWLSAAQLPPQTRRDVLIIPDPNVRVQAVVDGQGIALMDDLVSDELAAGKLHRLSDMTLPNYGYFIVRPDRAKASQPAKVFSDWLQDAVSARNQSKNASAP